MTAQVIDGRAMAAALHAEAAEMVKALGDQGAYPGLVTIMAGEDYRAAAYERRLRRVSAELGVAYTSERLPSGVAPGVVHALVRRLNHDPDVNGILVLRPLPVQVAEGAVFQALDPAKDIESVHPQNAGLLALGSPRFLPSTPASVYHLLDRWLESVGEDTQAFYRRSTVAVVGRSNNVGKPAASLAILREATVVSLDVHAFRAGRLAEHTRRADVVVVAAGVAGLIGAEHVAEGAIVIDVGINLVEDPGTGRARFVGDVDFAAVAKKARAITPVPGGVGPVTDVWLLRNVLQAARLAYGL